MSKKDSDQKLSFGISSTKKQGVKFPSKKVKAKDLGNISFDLSKEEEIMRKTPGLMENSMIENITTMNSIFEQKQSERLMLDNINKISNNNNNNNSLNSSLGQLGNNTFNVSVNSNVSIENTTTDNPLDQAVIIKDSSEIKENKTKKSKINKTKILIIVIFILVLGSLITYLYMLN